MAEHSGPVRGSGDVAMEMRAEMQGGRLPRVGGTDRRSQEGRRAGIRGSPAEALALPSLGNEERERGGFDARV